MSHSLAGRARLTAVATALVLGACLSPSGKLGEDPMVRVEIDRATAFEALEASASIENDRDRLLEERRLKTRFDMLTLRLPRDVEVRTAGGALALRLDDRAGARRALENAVRVDPSYVPAATLYARLLTEDGDLEGARAVLSTARLLAPGSGELMLSTAHVESLDGDHQAALEWLDQAAETEDVPMWRVEADRGVVFERAGRPIDAEAAFDAARELAPDPDLVPRS